MIDGIKKVIKIRGDTIGEIKSFKYLELFVQKNGGFDENVKCKIKSRLIK